MPETKWTLETIKQGIDKFLIENGHLPTAWDFDRSLYLPSSRHIQRAFGGLEKLRSTLGYSELNYTKGLLRRERSLSGHKDGLLAEDQLEVILIEHFGEPFVHTQKRYYKQLKNRYDFFIYAQGQSFGVDVFTTRRAEYIGPNIRHKLHKYKDVPATTSIFFVVASDTLTHADIMKGSATALGLVAYPNITVLHLSEFLSHITTLRPLPIPAGFVSALT